MGGGSLASVTTPSVVADTLIQDQCSLDFGDGLLGGEGQLGSHAGEEGQLDNWGHMKCRVRDLERLQGF